MIDRVRALLGAAIFEHLIPLQFEDGYIKIAGFLGKPQIASQNQQKQYLFVNNRKVTDKLISLAVKESFGTLLPAANTPVFLLHISLPHEVVDVNVHPRKEQVSFMNSRMIFDGVKLAVTQTLIAHNVTFHLAKFQEESTRKGETQSFTGQLLKEMVLPWDRQSLGTQIKNAPIIQIHQTYLLTSTKDGMVLIDQHAAHERILYEQFVQAFEQAEKKKQTYALKKPVTLDLSVIDKQLMEEYKEIFCNLGFILEPFQGESFLIRKAPVLFKGRNIERIIKDILDDLSQDVIPKTIGRRSQRMLAFLSCRAAVKAGDVLTTEQAKEIVESLEKMKNNVTCPHGRPTKVFVSLEHLHKYFKRQ